MNQKLKGDAEPKTQARESVRHVSPDFSLAGVRILRLEVCYELD